MMERKAYTAFGETGFGETERHRMSSKRKSIPQKVLLHSYLKII